MSSYRHSPAYALFLMLVLGASGLCLTLKPGLLGMVLVLWSFLALEKLMTLWGAVQTQQKRQFCSGKHVRQLLKGLHRKDGQNNLRAFEHGTKPSLLAAMMVNIAFCFVVMSYSSTFPLYTITMVMLGGIVFWVMQSASHDAHYALRLLMGIIVLAAIQVASIYADLSWAKPEWQTPGVLSAVILFGGLSLIIFGRGVFYRRHYRYFPFTGGFLAGAMLLLMIYVDPASNAQTEGLFMTGMAGIGICFAQSFPRYRRHRRSLLVPLSKLYT